MRRWSKYLNSQKYSECQLVTALNAYYHLTGKVYCKQDSQEYEDLVDGCCARNGAAIGIEKTHKQLGLRTVGYSPFLFPSFKTQWLRKDALARRKKGIFPKKHYYTETNRGKIELPIEITVWHKMTGFHSALIVDHCLKTEAYRIANFRHATSTGGWMFTEDLRLYLDDMNKGWCFRLFGLRKKKNG